MSHFLVLVIGENPQEKLAPYQENNMGDCTKKYLKFNDMEEEIQNDFDNETILEWYNNGRDNNLTKEQYEELKEKKDIIFINRKISIIDAVSYEIGKILCLSYEYPKELWDNENSNQPRWSEDIYAEVISCDRDQGYIKNCHLKLIDPPQKIPLKEKYKTFREVAEEYHGYKIDEETGKYGYWENPNAKWDWYSLGGRWSGVFKLKHENAGTIGVPGIFNNEPRYDADQTKKGNIDWEHMNNDSKRKEELDETWERNYVRGEGIYKKEYWEKKYGNKENYIKQEMCFSTYAVITDDGEWHSPGDMGWCGCSSETIEEKNEFEKTFFDRFIKDLPNDTLLSVFDCHI